MTNLEDGADARRAFESLIARYLEQDGVAAGTGFGGNQGLRRHGHIFAMLARGELVVKLPPDRVAQLIAAGRGHAFDSGKGRPLHAWLAVSFHPGSAAGWADLVAEAFEAGSEA